MPLKKLFEDNFDNGLKLEIVRPYYGRYQLNSGSLVVGVLEGVNNNWYTGIHRSAMVALRNIGQFYTGDELVGNRRSGKVNVVETRVTGISSTGDNCTGGICLFVDRKNVINMGYNNEISKIWMEKGYNDSFSYFYESAVVVDPSVSPHIYRIIWNPTPYVVSYDWFNGEIGANTVAFSYSDDDGVSFTDIGSTYTFEFSVSNISVGLFLKNWPPYPASNISFDYLRYYQAYNESQKYKKIGSLIEDEFAVPVVGGKEKHKSPIGETDGLFGSFGNSALLDGSSFPKVSSIRKYRSAGGVDRDILRLPGSISLPDSEINEKFELGGAYDSDGTGRDLLLKTTDASINYHTQMPAGAFIPGRKNTYDPEKTRNKEYFSFEDGGFVEIDEPYYVRGKVDSHGNDFIYGKDVHHLFYYDASTDMWSSLMTGTGLYGARRDGVLCYDGNPGGPGGFGTLAGGYNRTAWQVNEEPYGYKTTNDTEIDIDLIADDTIRFSTNTSISSPTMRGGGVVWFMGYG